MQNKTTEKHLNLLFTLSWGYTKMKNMPSIKFKHCVWDKNDHGQDIFDSTEILIQIFMTEWIMLQPVEKCCLIGFNIALNHDI
jgi:hypothetical protein